MRRDVSARSMFGRSASIGAAALAVALSVAIAQAQPRERPDGPPDRGVRGEGFGGPREDRDGPPPGGPGGRREGRGGPRGGGPREGRGGPGGPPSPERFVEHAMKFDVDGDGKLDRDELTKFAEEIQRMRPGGGGRGERGPEGDGEPRGRGPDEFGGPDGFKGRERDPDASRFGGEDGPRPGRRRRAE